MDVDIVDGLGGGQRCPVAFSRIVPIPIHVPVLVQVRVESVGVVPLRAVVHRVVVLELPLVVLLVGVVAVVPVLIAWVTGGVASLTPVVAAAAVPAVAVVACPVVTRPVVAPAVVAPAVVAPAVVAPPVE